MPVAGQHLPRATPDTGQADTLCSTATPVLTCGWYLVPVSCYPVLGVRRPNSEGGCNSEHKGMKFNHWEGGHRVTSFVGGPHLAASLRGRWYNQTVHLVDLHATILDLARLYVAFHAGLPVTP